MSKQAAQAELTELQECLRVAIRRACQHSGLTIEEEKRCGAVLGFTPCGRCCNPDYCLAWSCEKPEVDDG